MSFEQLKRNDHMLNVTSGVYCVFGWFVCFFLQCSLLVTFICKYVSVYNLATNTLLNSTTTFIRNGYNTCARYQLIEDSLRFWNLNTFLSDFHHRFSASLWLDGINRAGIRRKDVPSPESQKKSIQVYVLCLQWEFT